MNMNQTYGHGEVNVVYFSVTPRWTKSRGWSTYTAIKGWHLQVLVHVHYFRDPPISKAEAYQSASLNFIFWNEVS
jgi:hypothetical protein